MSGTATSAPIPSYIAISSTETKRIAQFESSDVQTKSDIAYIRKNAPNLKTVTAFLKDYRSLTIVLNAFGMGANIQQTALIRKLLTEDPTSTSSTAHKLANPIYTRFAKAMGQFKPPPFASATNVNAIVTAMGTNNFEAAQGAQTPGMADALYFKRAVGSLTSVAQLMSDPRLLKVATIATNMPDQFGSLDYSVQVKLLSKQIDMAKFAKAGYTDKFVERFLTLNAAANSSVTDSTGASAILGGSGSSGNILSALAPAQTSSSTASILSLFA